MSAIGYIRVAAYTSRARIPLEDTAVTVVDNEGKLLGLRLTDSSGMTMPIRLEVPNLSNSQTPDTGLPAYMAVNLYARAEGYEQILARNIQVFADTVTTQELAMIPLSELPEKFNQAEVFDTPPQNL